MNENRSGCFGWALEHLIANGDAENDTIRVRPDTDQCVHHHTNSQNLVGKGSVIETPALLQKGSLGSSLGKSRKSSVVNNPGRSFIWWPSLSDLKNHYLKELGFLASLAQFCGATIFWVRNILNQVS